MKRVVIGGSAVPEAMIRSFEQDYAVQVIHAWGMTETSPLGTLNFLMPHLQLLEYDEQMPMKLKQGKSVFGIDIRIVDESGKTQPHDGKAFGRLQARGHWVTAGYYNSDEDTPVDSCGWFDTGDVATIDQDGYMMITDRTKDVIKSGGEWISSVDLENHIVAIEGVVQAAVIAQPHPKWDERPVALVILAEGAKVTSAQILEHCLEKFASWQLPDDILFVTELPLTSTGKLDKKAMRARLDEEGYELPDQRG